ILALFFVWKRFQIGEPLGQHSPLAFLSTDTSILEFRARVLWTVSALTFATITGWTFVMALIVMFRHTRHEARRLWLLITSLLAVEFVIIYSFATHWDIGGAGTELIRVAISNKTSLDFHSQGSILARIGAVGVAVVITAICSLTSDDSVSSCA